MVKETNSTSCPVVSMGVPWHIRSKSWIDSRWVDRLMIDIKERKKEKGRRKEGKERI